MARTVWRLTNRGARAPGTNTAPINRSAWHACSRMLCALLITVSTFGGITSSRYRSRSRSMSRITTSAPSPAAIFAAFAPTTPPPRITTFAADTPGTPASNRPRPCIGSSRYLAPS